MTVWFDVSSLVRDPRRSGIQRVQRALLRHWPEPAELRPCRFDPASITMRALAPAIIPLLCGDAPPGGAAEEAEQLRPWLEAPGEAVERGGARIFCAELFDEADRAAYYRALLGAGTAFWLVYDALPWLRPEWYAAGPATRLMPYLRAMRDIPRLAFISAATRRDYADRILRRPDPGPVISLGADGLGLKRQSFAPGKRDIVMLGTIEPRKNTAAALRAARRLWADGADFRLVLIGMVEHDAREERALLQDLAGEPRLVRLGAAPDPVVREALGLARALLFPSRAEGYGLPAMEALAAGLPVVVASDLPALEGWPEAGQIRLETVDEPSIAAALRRLLDDRQALELWSGAATLHLPGWREFAAGIAEWISCPAR